MRTISVTGHGAASAVPDTAVLRVAAVHRAASLADALAGAESARAEVVRAAGDLVVSTSNLSVWPVREPGQERDELEARHALTIAVGDLVVAGELLGRLASEIGDRLVVDGVELAVGDPSAAVAAAREAAFADARNRAEHLAALAGVTLGLVEAVLEGGSAAPAPLGLAKAEVVLQPGETSVTAAVTVTWSVT